MCGICGCDQGPIQETRSPLTSTPSTTKPPTTTPSTTKPPTQGHPVPCVELATLGSEKTIAVEKSIFSSNNEYAQRNRHFFNTHNLFTVNLVSSPGSGKTTLLCETLARLKENYPVAVVEGDQRTSRDAQRISETGAAVLQVNTGKGCHLDAHMVSHAIPKLPLAEGGFLFIENVGNLVCPANFDLGENQRAVILSTTEGDDKPLKYPDIFSSSQLLIINKIDLLPYVEFSTERCIQYAKEINPNIEVIELSATRGDQFEQWIQWLIEHQVKS